MEKRIIEVEGKGFHRTYLKNQPDSKTILIKNLPNKKYQLKKHLSISINQDKNTHIASYDDLESFGLGENEHEAVNDLLYELIEIYKDIENNSQPLGKSSKLWWHHLNTIIRKKANA